MSELALTSQTPGWLKKIAKMLKAVLLPVITCRKATFPPLFLSCHALFIQQGLALSHPRPFIPLDVEAKGSWELMLMVLMVQGHQQLLISDAGIEVVRSEQSMVR